MARLMSVFLGVTLIGISVAGVRELLAGRTRWLAVDLAMAVLLAAALAFLLLRRQAPLWQLRVLETGVFGAAALYLATQTFVYGIEALSAPEWTSATWGAMLLRFALLMIAYGIFVPNTPLRAAVGITAIGATPILTAFLVRAQHPELAALFDAAIAGNLFETVLLLGAAAGVAVFAAFLVGNLFDFAFEQRRRTFYDLEEQIGSGGMGEVWRARHRTLARPTAVKLIREDRVAESDGDEALRILRRFEREAKATAALRSPHTIDVYDFGVTADGHFFYAMEFLEGIDLETLVEDHGPVPQERAVHLLLQACDSLADAHEHGLIHRDIKPANMFATRLGPSNDYLKILDFGLVRTPPDDDGAERLTDEQTTTGTPAYMAPEQALQRDEVDGRSDIYALGATAYWLLTGKYVFDADGGVAMIVEHVRTEPTPPSRRTEMPVCPELDAVVMKCLAKDPAERYQNARELAVALAAVPLPEPWTAQRAAEWWDLHFPSASAA
ncbi:MAG: serine/threonine-protein kinase [Acidobacteriota bacterium]|jgi:serine/threonine-protein kinase